MFSGKNSGKPNFIYIYIYIYIYTRMYEIQLLRHRKHMYVVYKGTRK